MTDTAQICLERVSLSVMLGGRRIRTLDDVTAEIPPGRVALVGESRVAAISVIDLLVRRVMPQSGRVQFNGRVSWPLGHSAPFSVSVTGKQVVTHFSAIYGFDRTTALAFIDAELGWCDIHLPMETWPRSVQTKFMLLIGLIPNFEQYIVDGHLLVSDDPVFSKRYIELFHYRTRGKSVLIAARQSRLALALCNKALIVARGQLQFTEDVAAAIKLNERINLGIGRRSSDEAAEDDTDEFLL